MQKVHRSLAAALALTVLVSASLATAPQAQAAPPVLAAAGDAKPTAAPVETMTREQAEALARKLLPIDPSLTRVDASYDESQGSAAAWSLRFTLPKEQVIPGEPAPATDVRLRAADGVILSYSFAPGNPTGRTSGSLSLSRDQAREAMNQFLRAINPPNFGAMVLSDDAEITGYGGDVNYSFHFDRYKWGRLVIGPGGPEGVQVTMSAVDGSVRSYQYNWTDNLVFPAGDVKVDQNQALQIYRSQTEFALAYWNVQDPLADRPDYLLGYGRTGNRPARIDAFTGDLVNWDGTAVKTAQTTPPAPIAKATEGLTLPLDKAGAEARARNLLGLPAEATLRSSTLGGEGDNQTWGVSFTQDLGDGKSLNASAQVRVSDGALLGCYQYSDVGLLGTKVEPKYTSAQLAPKASEFLTAALGKEAGDWRPLPSGEESQTPGYVPTTTTFRYGFVHNGHLVRNTSAQVEVSRLTGAVQAFWLNRPDETVTYPDDKGVPTADQAFGAWREAAGLQLVYWAYRDTTSATGKIDWLSAPVKVALVWQPPTWVSDESFVPANTLRLTDTQGHDILAMRRDPVDLTGAGAKELTILISQRFYAPDASGHIYPEKSVTRGEALKLLLTQQNIRPLGMESGAVAKLAMNDRASSFAGYIAAAYATGILDATETEFKPDEPVTRELFAALAARTLGYGAVARMSVHIPLPDAKDADKVSPMRRNALALMLGLKVLDLQEGTLAPQVTMSRADAAIAMVRIMTLKR